MRTLGEVIRDAERWQGLEPGSLERDALFYLRMYKELADDSEAFAAWKENPPLTWDELKQMEGKPVWVEHNLFKGWRLVGWQANEHCMILVGSYSEQVPLFEDDCGVTWNAYRKERK